MIDDDRTAGGEVNRPCERRFNLAFNLVTIKERYVIGVMFQFADIMRHDLLHEFAGVGKDLFVIDQDFTDIIAKIKTELPPIAKEAGVSLVVAKTQIAYKDPSVEYVDITAQLVKLFNPSDEVLKIIEQMSKKEPVPIDKLSMDPKI